MTQTAPAELGPASIVYFATGSLLLHGPDSNALPAMHLQGRWVFGTYVNDPDRPGTAKRVGTEMGWSRCRRLLYDEHNPSRRVPCIRYDVAQRLGVKPCRVCFGKPAEPEWA